MQSVLQKATHDDVNAEPFPHALVRNALAADYYDQLSAAFPTLEQVARGQRIENNRAYLLSGQRCLESDELAPIWRNFMQYHLSHDFFREACQLLGDKFRQMHPEIDRLIGRPLERATVGMRRPGATEDILLDCQFGINSPVAEESRVRGIHVDNHRKLFNALLYMRVPDDNSRGGELALYRDEKPLQWGFGGDLYGVQDEAVTECGRVAYSANLLVMFVNSPRSFHGVTPRSVTPHVRRYINFLAEVRQPLFPLPA